MKDPILQTSYNEVGEVGDLTNELNEQLQRALRDAVKKLGESSEVPPHNLGSVGDLDYVKMEHKIHLRKGKWRRYSEEMEIATTLTQRLGTAINKAAPSIHDLKHDEPAGVIGLIATDHRSRDNIGHSRQCCGQIRK
jgi:hypothetical protein